MSAETYKSLTVRELAERLLHYEIEKRVTLIEYMEAEDTEERASLGSVMDGMNKEIATLETELRSRY